jgi:hypothetical protein
MSIETHTIDLQRCLSAMKSLTVEGLPNNPGRLALIEEAIKRIQLDGTIALKHEYLGFKNYAHFGDQRTDCSYGMGPRHGSIVFSINRHHQCEELGAEHIYLLECVRDFCVFRHPTLQDDFNQPKQFNLCSVLRLITQLQADIAPFLEAIANRAVTEEAKIEVQS